MVAICGRICSGKSTLLAKLQAKGFKVFNSDEFVNEIYESIEFINEIKHSKLKVILSDNLIDKKKILNLIKNNYALFKELEQKVHQKIYEHLLQNNYDYAEIPVLNSEHANFLNIIKEIIVVNLPFEIRENFCKKRNINSKKFLLLNNMNNLSFLMDKSFKKIKQIWLNSIEEIEEFLSK
ncbi:dephospho-CoA kinase [Mycoplasmopsis citelli]|uniref:dephospho-CoA kinase n=1 Tax=Mycoplasmopsis citelli TaxID=171281 RepID=UPI002115724A|nr:dephospho-CoA kinase [Mycoplasmopsis citelli]UUD35802.1 dephospho-CoA kinase [Mycoplasmopsis citelli]